MDIDKNKLKEKLKEYEQDESIGEEESKKLLEKLKKKDKNKLCDFCGHKKGDHAYYGGICNKYIKKGKAIFECNCVIFEESLR